MKVLNKQMCRVLACAAMLAAALPASAAGALVYDNGAPDHVSANNMGYAWQADDFSLASGASVNAISFWSLEAAGAYRGAISWAIVGNSGGAPGGTMFASGTVSDVARTSLGSYLGLNEYRNDFTLGTPLDLGAGSYWLVLHNGGPADLGDPNEFLWETTVANGTLRGMETYDGTTWSGNFNEHAFQVSAVPEPASVLMLAAGMLVVGGLRRRARQDRFTA
jgi:hypothetical protein